MPEWPQESVNDEHRRAQASAVQSIGTSEGFKVILSELEKRANASIPISVKEPTWAQQRAFHDGEQKAYRDFHNWLRGRLAYRGVNTEA